MKPSRDREKRQHRRYVLAVPPRIRAAGLTLVGMENPRHGIIRGRIQDISNGGFCLLTNQRLKVGLPVRCEVAFAPTPVAVPTLMRVQWFRRSQNGEDGFRYSAGLQFLL